jgi:hypothetical protein
MRTFVITSSCLALALLLTSFVMRNGGDGALSLSRAAISTLDLTLAAGPLTRPDYADAH